MGAGHNHGPAVDEKAGLPGDYRRKLWIAFGITAMIAVAQAVGSVVTGSADRGQDPVIEMDVKCDQEGVEVGIHTLGLTPSAND